MFRDGRQRQRDRTRRGRQERRRDERIRERASAARQKETRRERTRGRQGDKGGRDTETARDTLGERHWTAALGPTGIVREIDWETWRGETAEGKTEKRMLS